MAKKKARTSSVLPRAEAVAAPAAAPAADVKLLRKLDVVWVGMLAALVMTAIQTVSPGTMFSDAQILGLLVSLGVLLVLSRLLLVRRRAVRSK